VRIPGSSVKTVVFLFLIYIYLHCSLKINLKTSDPEKLLIFVSVMKKHSILKLMNFVALLSVVIYLTTCKKGEEPASSDPSPPVAMTNSASWVGQTWATLKGTVTANDQNTIVTFEYDTITAYEHSIKATPDTVTGSTSTTVISSLTGLLENTTYHYRVKAVSSVGTSYGSDVTFTTSDTVGIVINFNPNLTYGSVSDNNGNTYKTIQIGTQTWMAENLKTVKYNDGTAIPFITEGTAWAELSTPGYCWYNNYSVSYGGIYNWYSVNTGKLCPTGWHIPTDVEWTVLTDYLGGGNIAGNKLKETGSTHWLGSNAGATNESGFTAIPSGYRNYYGTFSSIRSYGYWWSSTAGSSTGGYFRDLYYGYDYVDRSSSSKKGGFSVRCLNDN
jgi:uncharacterized protein (TIGR02145 family)